jgi:hypothetical protein
MNNGIYKVDIGSIRKTYNAFSFTEIVAELKHLQQQVADFLNDDVTEDWHQAMHDQKEVLLRINILTPIFDRAKSLPENHPAARVVNKTEGGPFNNYWDNEPFYDFRDDEKKTKGFGLWIDLGGD